MRAGIIGSGFAGKFHFVALKWVYGSKVEDTGAYARNAENLEVFTRDKGLMSFKSLEELIDQADVLHQACRGKET